MSLQDQGSIPRSSSTGRGGRHLGKMQFCPSPFLCLACVDQLLILGQGFQNLELLILLPFKALGGLLSNIQQSFALKKQLHLARHSGLQKMQLARFTWLFNE